MAEFPKTYSLATDFGGSVNTTKLEAEIKARAEITTGTWGVDLSGDNVTVKFKADPSAGEITALTGDVSPPGAGSVLALHDSSVSSKADLVELSGVPKTSDGKVIFQPAVFRGDQSPVYAGAADNDITGTRGDGFNFLVQQSENTAGTPHVYDWRFIDIVYIFAGEAKAFNGANGDWVNFSLVAPATAKVTNGSGTGNCNAVPTGAGFNVLVPAAGDGGYDVNLTEALSANLSAKPQGCPTKVTKATPVPAYDSTGLPNGYWDWDEGTGAITASVTPGSAPWNLYDAEITLNRWVNRLQLWSPDAMHGIEYKMQIPTKAKKILPHWLFRVELDTSDAARQVSLTWFLVMGRKITT